MPIRTQESLQKLFEASRLRNEKKKRLQEKKYKNAQESTKKALADKLSTKDKKLAQKAQEQPQIEFSRIITIYNSKYVERFIGEDDLYTSREELEEAMPHNINWVLWDSLVNKTKNDLKDK
jgi:hypothetical protein